ncbi:hypothetical protein [Mucilaginibacter sp. L196]|uniref:hypothetical protein n=1 Tax=Mucilaginibacter sp. L196 TaxID=1641870 RepID=UPI00131B4861|nr:hypothetical protein [Mucilaginibacter sp. L196]
MLTEDEKFKALQLEFTQFTDSLADPSDEDFEIFFNKQYTEFITYNSGYLKNKDILSKENGDYMDFIGASLSLREDHRKANLNLILDKININIAKEIAVKKLKRLDTLKADTLQKIDDISEESDLLKYNDLETTGVILTKDTFINKQLNDLPVIFEDFRNDSLLFQVVTDYRKFIFDKLNSININENSKQINEFITRHDNSKDYLIPIGKIVDLWHEYNEKNVFWKKMLLPDFYACFDKANQPRIKPEYHSKTYMAYLLDRIKINGKLAESHFDIGNDVYRNLVKRNKENIEMGKFRLKYSIKEKIDNMFPSENSIIK